MSMQDLLSQFAFKKTPRKPLSSEHKPIIQKSEPDIKELEKSENKKDLSIDEAKKRRVPFSEKYGYQAKKVKKNEDSEQHSALSQQTSDSAQEDSHSQSVDMSKHSGKISPFSQLESALEMKSKVVKELKFTPPKKPSQDAPSKPTLKVLEINNLEDLSVFKDSQPQPIESADSGKKKKSAKEKAELSSESEFGVEYDPEKFKFSEASLNLPEWAREPNIRDKKGRAPGQEGYDPTTLYIPPKALTKMGNVMKKYWKVKSQHYDKLIFIRVSKVYFVYHRDAYVCHTELGSRLASKPDGSTIVYLYPPKINMYCQRLLEKDYKIVLVEPTKADDSDDDDETERDIYQIITKGTFIESNPKQFTSRYCLFLSQKDQEWGFTYVDTTTHEFYMGEFVDTPNRTKLYSLLLTVMPVEIAFREMGIVPEAITLLKSLYWKPVITPLALLRPKGVGTIASKLRRYLPDEMEEEKEQENPNLKDNKESGANLEVVKNLVDIAQNFLNETQEEQKETKDDTRCPNYGILQSLFLSLEYLEYLCLADKVFRSGRFFFHNLKRGENQNLTLDGQAVQNLELFEVSYSSNETAGMSLFKYMDKTSTAFGKRMLQKWLLEPMKDVKRINERLDAVEDFLENMSLCETIQAKLSKLPDLERMIHNIYNFRKRYIFHMLDFEAYVKPKLNLFAEILTQLREVHNMIKSFSGRVSTLKSKRLRQLLNFTSSDLGNTTEGLFPKMDNLLVELESLIVIQEKTPVPAPGQVAEYDVLRQEADDIKQKIQQVLIETRKRLKCESINYVHIKHRYELEVPESVVEGKKRPADFQITSKKKGFMRFHTPEIKDLTWKLYELDHEMHKVTLPFLVDCFKKFHDYSTEWQHIVACLGEIDCLASLAQLAKSMKLSCKPHIVKKEKDKQVFDLRGVVHPCLADKVKDFVKNDVVLEKDQSIFLITGPNMGGKSTLMRTVCIATIMAQIGSFVPAESFKLTVRDRIFTRIGARDSLREGKSTFYIELEETLNIVEEATEDSLVIMDELGRGTSTYDGMSIAYAVLKYLSEKIQCLTLFATHYHLLIEELKFFKNVSSYYMDCKVLDEEVIKFLYKFQKGSIGNSFGLSIAKIVGLSNWVIKKAKEKADSMMEEMLNEMEIKKVSSSFNKVIELISDLEEEYNKQKFEELIREVNNNL